MLVSEFNFHLPPERIAQAPLADRAASRLLHLDRSTGECVDRQFRDFPSLLRPDDLLVFNNTRVFPARLYGRREGLNAQPVSEQNPASRDFLRGRIEVLLTRQISEDPNEWECLVRPGRKIGVGEKLYFGEADGLQAEVISRRAFGERCIRFAPTKTFFECLEQIGHVPLPPYIDRGDSREDRDRYQTVYAQTLGSVAAPTAGLHFTYEILREIRALNVETAEITLHVGLGTFQPVHVSEVEDHKLHSETYEISQEAAHKINEAVKSGRRVIAVGTTTVRTLEFAARFGDGTIVAGPGEANIFIYPGYEFCVVKGVLTNFHLPQSTLLMLVCAFAGKEQVLRAYRHAIKCEYRFYSYGDCMFVE